MRKFLLCLATMALSAGIAEAQTTIAAARAQGVGATVTVAGTVTNGAELGAPLRYFQDATGGLAGYSSTLLTGVNVGDSIIISGTIKSYNQLLEIDPVTSVQVVATGRTVQPVVFSSGYTAAYAEQYESMLVRLNGLVSVKTTSGATVTSFSGNTNYNLNSSYSMRVNSASTGTDGIVGKPAPTASFDLIGIMSQFHSTNPASGYQLLPRLYSDFILGNTPNLSSSLSATDITTTSFKVHFSTLNNGDTKFEYGTTTALGSQVYDATQTTTHSLTISGLSPATVYYVKATSTNANGSSSSQIIPFITASTSAGWIKTYFNASVDTTKALPGNATQQLLNAIDDTLIAYINRAQQTLDIAIYNWNNAGLSDISAAVNNAFNRGVAVRVVADGSTANAGLGDLVAGINKVLSTQGSAYGLMHNKFVVIDAALPANAIVWTGATNWTQGQINEDPNNVIIFQDQSMAVAYTMEFNEMFGSSTTTPGTPKFGPDKTNNTPHYFNVGGRPVEVYFSPSDGTNSKLISTIASASHDLGFATMLNTRSDIAVAIRDAYNALSDKACSFGVINDTIGASGPWFTMSNGMGANLVKYSGAHILHHKYILIDANSSSDPLIWTGTHNWSNSAENRNDENTVIVHDALIANQYYQELSARMAAEGKTPCAAINVTGIHRQSSLDFILYPNPNSGRFNINIESLAADQGTLNIVDLSGRIVASEKVNLVNGSNVLEMDVKLNPGIYFIKLDAKNKLIAKMIVQ